MRDDNQYSIPSVHVVDDEKLQDELKHPVPPGGNLPQLNLADSPGFSVASGKSFQAMPEPIKPDIVWPDLSGSSECGGYDPSNPAPPAPGLAGCMDNGFSTPASSPILPDYGLPDFASLNKSLIGTSEDLAQAKIDYSPGGEFGPDPMNPDLTDYRKPMGLDFYPESYSNLWAPDPSLDGDATNPDIPSGIAVINHPEDPDPSVQDLQNPQLELQVKMDGRPGEMDPSALDILHQAPTYDQVKGVSYDLSYMVQPGSSRRARHMDMLMHGLDGDL